MTESDRDRRMALAMLPLVLLFLAFAVAENAVARAIRSVCRTPGRRQTS